MEPQRQQQKPQRLTDCDKVTSADNDNICQGDLSDEFGRFFEPTVEIADVPTLYRPRQAKRGEKKNKLLVRFVGKRKAWVCGPVSRKILKAMYGRFLEHWVGKKITLYVDPDVKFGTEKTGGIRVRPMILSGPVTSETLDRPVDEEAAAARDAAVDRALEEQERGDAREPGEEG
jgi:hypothetical protein